MDSKFLEVWISSQTAWAPAPAVWQHGGKLFSPPVAQKVAKPCSWICLIHLSLLGVQHMLPYPFRYLLD